MSQGQEHPVVVTEDNAISLAGLAGEIGWWTTV